MHISPLIRLYISFILRFLIGFLILTAFVTAVSGGIAGLTGTDLRLWTMTEFYEAIIALPVTFWAFFTALNGKYDRFDIIFREKANSGDRCDE